MSCCFGAIAQKTNLDSLNKILVAVYDKDQMPRILLDSLEKIHGFDSDIVKKQWESINKNDSTNIMVVSSILDKYGWLDSTQISSKGSDALFFAIQHSEVTIQSTYVPLLQLATKEGRLSKKRYAYFIDRLNLQKGEYQLYGTQFQGRDQKSMRLYPIIDAPNLDKRRQEVGLEGMEAFAKEIGFNYTPTKKDHYKNKYAWIGNTVDEQENPVPFVVIYTGENHILGQSDKDGYFQIPLTAKQLHWAFIFRKEGFLSSSILLPYEKARKVYNMDITVYKP